MWFNRNKTVGICPICAWLPTNSNANKAKSCPYCKIGLVMTDMSIKQYVYRGNNSMGIKTSEELATKFVYNNPHYSRAAELRRKECERAQIETIFNNIDERTQYQPKCPTCGSPNVRKIGEISKAVSVGTLGLASNKLGKTYECLNCEYKW